MIQQEPIEATPEQNFLRAKKDKHAYSISTEAFSSQGREFVLHNVSLKREYRDAYDYLNYRRGLAYLEEIIDFKHTAPIVARKGLRKFTDLLPEYLQLKESHVTNSKFHSSEKNRLLRPLKNPIFTSFIVYNTQKLNGENAQLSFFEERWVIGSKNKCLMVAGPADLAHLRNKHEHKLTILIAQAWFTLLDTRTEQQIAGIKLELEKHTLIGQYCNSQNMQHLVDYGKQPQLFFYALVAKENRIDDCLPTSAAYKFIEAHGLPAAKYQRYEAETIDDVLERLRAVVVATNEQTMRDGGEGSVLYISGVTSNGQHNVIVCKVKTIEYRIYRKLREKLKVYIQKLNKGYDNLLKKFSKEIAELAREFHVKRPLQAYVQLAHRSFKLCQDQSRPISKFVHNRFIHFLRLAEKNVTREKFMEIVNSSAAQLEQLGDEEQQKEEILENQVEGSKEREKKSEQAKVGKKVIVLIPVTIPSTGKTSLLQIIAKEQPDFKIWSISSDQTKRKVMDDLRKRKKTMTHQQAFEKSRDQANKQFFKAIGETLSSIAHSFEQKHVFYIDKNHPENSLRKTNDTIIEGAAPLHNIQVLRIGLFPDSVCRFEEKGIYRYPFSSAYILTCLKRVSNRPEHLTLEGSDEDRIRIVLGFANMFRNFSLSPYNIRRYFDGKIQFTFNNQQCLDQEKDAELLALFKEVLLSGKPGSFDINHPKFEQLVEAILKWDLKQLPREQCAANALSKLKDVFSNFENFGKYQEKEEKQQ